MKKTIIIILILLFPLVCFAEPSSTIKYLVTEKATLFDLGMIQLQIMLFRHSTEVVRKETSKHWARKYSDFDMAFSGVDIEYQSDTNRLLIHPFIIIKGKPSNQRLKAFSKEYLESLRTMFGVPFKLSNLYPDFASLSPLFSHLGLERTSQPKDVEAELDKIVEVQIDVRSYNWNIVMSCQGKLVDNKEFYSK